ncbi:MAG TPA: hypothetical protein V6D48_02010 [Oculatellaceae cyanobacterium]
MKELLNNPSFNGLTGQYGENLERMQRAEKFILLATITTHFSCMYTGFILDKGNLSEAYWQNDILFHIADWTPTPVRRYLDELGKLDEEKLLKLCEFLVADLIVSREVIEA